MFWLWTLGSAFLFAVGNLLQKRGLNYAGQQASPNQIWKVIKAVLSHGAWWLGILVSAVATLTYYAALGRFNISLVQPMMALNPALTALGGWWLFREHLDRKTFMAIFFVFAGLVIAGTLANETAGVENPVRFWIFALFLVLFMITSRWTLLNFETRKAAVGGLGFGLSAVFMKSLLTLVETTSGGLGVWIYDVDILLRALGFTASYLTGFIYTQMGLTQGRALYIIPFSAALGMLIPIAAGALVFHEPFPMAKWFAVVCVLAGSCLFIRRA